MAPRSPNLSQHGLQEPFLGANMAPRTPLLEPTWPHNPPLGTNMAPGAPNLEPRWAQDPSNWPQLGPNPPKFKPKSIQKCATLSCRILAHNANMKCQTKLPKQMPSQTAKTQEGGGDSRSVLNIYPPPSPWGEHGVLNSFLSSLIFSSSILSKFLIFILDFF